MKSRIGLVLTVFLGLAPAAASCAQWASGDESAWTSCVDRALIEAFVAQDGLDEVVVSEAQRIYAEHHVRLALLVLEGRDREKIMTKAVGMTEPDSAQRVRANVDLAVTLDEYAERLRQEDRQTIRQLKALLNDDEISRFWSPLERRRRRETALPRSPFTDERVDVIALVGALDLSGLDRVSLDGIGALLQEYERSLDQLLQQRLESAIRSERSRVEWLRQHVRDDGERGWYAPERADGQPDSGSSAREQDRLLSIHRRIRTLNRQYFESVRQLLPTSQQQPYAAEWRRMRDPRLVSGALKAAARYAAKLMTGELREDQIEFVESVMIDHDVRAAALDDRAMDAHDDLVEAGMLGADILAARQAAAESLRVRFEFEEKTVESLFRALDERQAQMAPRPDKIAYRDPAASTLTADSKKE